MRTKTLLASMAVAGLAVAQPLSAATRSADSLPSAGIQPSVTSSDRVSSIVDESEDLRGKPILLIILLAGGLAALIAALSDGKSPG
jgi:hypothetical protein